MGMTTSFDASKALPTGKAALQLVIIDDRIAQVLIMLNPDKLGGLEEPREIAR
ncbi:MAG TPA: hypothetical protein VIT41_10690 [Microlunatus sp.]